MDSPWIAVLVIVAAVVGLYVYWRFVWFFRDPERTAPADESAILSPADGTVIYIKRITSEEPPVSLKKGRMVPLGNFIGEAAVKRDGYLIGVFMHPTSVHVNRSPIRGVVQGVEHKPGSNLPMTLTWWRTNLGLRPYESDATHLLQNERNIVHIAGELFDVLVVQIADIYVNRVECWVKNEQKVAAGDRVGMIRFGSQVDLYVAYEDVEILATLGQKVRAGETVLARVKPSIAIACDG